MGRESTEVARKAAANRRDLPSDKSALSARSDDPGAAKHTPAILKAQYRNSTLALGLHKRAPKYSKWILSRRHRLSVNELVPIPSRCSARQVFRLRPQASVRAGLSSRYDAWWDLNRAARSPSQFLLLFRSIFLSRSGVADPSAMPQFFPPDRQAPRRALTLVVLEWSRSSSRRSRAVPAYPRMPCSLRSASRAR